MDKSVANHYLAFSDAPVQIGDEVLQARIHWASVDGKATVVGVDLRAFYSEVEPAALRRALKHAGPGVGGWQEINTTTLRGFRLAEAVESSRQTLLGSLSTASTANKSRHRAGRKEVREALIPPPTTRGPAPVLSKEHLRDLVAPAYAVGGTKPVEAVREALANANIRGLGRRVTKEQAKKAVTKARLEGFIPPAKERKGR